VAFILFYFILFSVLELTDIRPLLSAYSKFHWPWEKGKKLTGEVEERGVTREENKKGGRNKIREKKERGEIGGGEGKERGDKRKESNRWKKREGTTKAREGEERRYKRRK
jgi:hypothetical protein